jgi:hypothetical protein
MTTPTSVAFNAASLEAFTRHTLNGAELKAKHDEIPDPAATAEQMARGAAEISGVQTLSAPIKTIHTGPGAAPEEQLTY